MATTTQASRQKTSISEAIDRKSAGLEFVDVLFALVIGELLERSRAIAALIVSGGYKEHLYVISHYSLAFTLVVTSWIGYRASVNAPMFKIRFMNLPLAKFILDILMVATYWLAVASIEEGPSQVGRWAQASAIPEAFLCSIAFTLYAVWDRLSLAMKPPAKTQFLAALRNDNKQNNSSLYDRDLLMLDTPERRKITWLIWTATSGIAAIAIFSPNNAKLTTFLDISLIMSLVAFRHLKEKCYSPEVEFNLCKERKLIQAWDVELFELVQDIRQQEWDGQKYREHIWRVRNWTWIFTSIPLIAFFLNLERGGIGESVLALVAAAVIWVTFKQIDWLLNQCGRLAKFVEKNLEKPLDFLQSIFSQTSTNEADTEAPNRNQ